jgi:hypothetical protein
MAKNELVPAFMPPLAALLARAEELKGEPLTESEVERIRDGAVCMMMESGRAEQLTESRGYRDVNPENAWADWHRLRAQMTGGFLPKIVLCLPGGKDFPKACEALLAKAGNEHEWRNREKQMANAFEASEFRVNPSLDDEDWELIEQHKSVLYVLSENFTAAQAPAASLAMLQLGRRLLEAGGSAIKCESSGIAHSRLRWISLAGQAEDAKDVHARWSAIFNAFVQYPISDDTDLYSCGMHLLGKPDLIVGCDAISAGEAVPLFGIFALYLLAECPEGEFASGHTFSLSNDAPRYHMLWEPCTGYDEDDFFFNPFGRWRFTPAGSKS